MLGSVLFSQIKTEPVCGDSLHTVEVLSKVLLATPSPYLGLVLFHISSEIGGFALLKLLLLVFYVFLFNFQQMDVSQQTIMEMLDHIRSIRYKKFSRSVVFVFLKRSTNYLHP